MTTPPRNPASDPPPLEGPPEVQGRPVGARGAVAPPPPEGAARGPDAEAPLLGVRLARALEERGIRYCHWKSNHRVVEGLHGDGDLDLLVRRCDAGPFVEVLAACGFRLALDPGKPDTPGVTQYYGHDSALSRLVQIDAYTRVVTGEKVLKEYTLPLESMLLEGAGRQDGLRVPLPEAELAVLIVRRVLKASAPLDLLLTGGRAHDAERRHELERLLVPGAAERALGLLRRELPAVPAELWGACLAAITEGAGAARRWRLGLRLRRALRPYRRMGGLELALRRVSHAAARLAHRVMGRRRSKRLAAGGAVVAFVGPEATGKSTLVRETAAWLGGAFATRVAHLGKPSPTALTLLPSLALPALRRLARGHRTDGPGSSAGPADRPVSALFALRCLMLAWERLALATRLHAQAGRGRLVVCDRYPSGEVGAMDSARLEIAGARGWRARAARLEQRLYRRIPPPDLVIRLTVPPQVALQRNRERDKPGKESDERLLWRHEVATVPTYPARTIEVGTEGDLDETVRRVRELVWREL